MATANSVSQNIEDILQMLQTMELQIMFEHQIEYICDTTVRHLVGVNVPLMADELKTFRRDLLKVGDLLEKMVRRSDNCEQIILVSLQTLYKLIVSTGEFAYFRVAIRCQ